MTREGEIVTAQRDGRPVNVRVTKVLTIPFGDVLPNNQGWMDATTDRDERNGIRVGVQGALQ